MLATANQEKEESAVRIKELEAKLTSINTAIQGHEKRKVTKNDVSQMHPAHVDGMLNNQKEL